MRKKNSLWNLILLNKYENNNMEKKMNINYFKKKKKKTVYLTLHRLFGLWIGRVGLLHSCHKSKRSKQKPKSHSIIQLLLCPRSRPMPSIQFPCARRTSIYWIETTNPVAMGVSIRPSSFALCMASLSTLSSKDLNTFSFPL